MPKSPLLVLPVVLLVSTPSSAAQPIGHPGAASSSRPVNHDDRDDWFRRKIGDLLEGRSVASHAPHPGH